ncbi:hypothetical protein [Janthinobacterium sp. UMAB-56]|uniref:hypothetical protein n=1 Tax=Janthinobacterium sp. UMAB-56 TaxID=1365361 RepID=UPI001C59204B|nr:hypothetical protein [Janthinobacterium sp. UMAB-56]
MRFIKQALLALLLCAQSAALATGLTLGLCTCGGPNDPTQPPAPKVMLAAAADTSTTVQPAGDFEVTQLEEWPNSASAARPGTTLTACISATMAARRPQRRPAGRLALRGRRGWPTPRKSRNWQISITAHP